jgi:hypothetical protein
MGKDPDVRIKWICANSPDARKRLRAIRKYVTDSELYHHVFPNIRLDKKEPNNESMLTLVRNTKTLEPTIEARGVLTTATGASTDILIMDDICDHRNSLQFPKLRPQVLHKLQSDWLQSIRDHRRGRILGIYNTWHAEDAHSWLEENTNWAHKTYAHGKPGDPFHSICPEIQPPAFLRQKRLDEGPINYARGRLCRKLTEDTALVLPEQLIPYNPTNLTADKLARAVAIVSVDPASGKEIQKGRPDFDGFAVGLFVPALDPRPDQANYEVFIPLAYQTRLTTRLQVQHIKQLIQQWKPEVTLIEAQGLQNLHEWLWQDKHINTEQIIPITVGATGKGQRLMSCTPFLAPPEGPPPRRDFHPNAISSHPTPIILRLPEGDRPEALCTFRHQVINFPTDHDDVLDAVTQLLRYIRTYLVPTIEDPASTKPTLDITEINIGGRKKDPPPIPLPEPVYMPYWKDIIQED